MCVTCNPGSAMSNFQSRVHSSGCRGYSMMEVLVTVAIVAILAALAVPILNTQDSKLDTAAFNLRSHLLLARSEAAKQNKNVQIRVTDGGKKYEIRVDGGAVLKSASLEKGLSVTNSTIVGFSPLGSATSMNFTVSNADGETAVVNVTNTGKITIK